MNKYNKLNITSEQMRFLKKKLNITKMEDIEITVLKDLKDTRQKSKTHYKIWDIVCYVIFAQMSGAEDWTDIEEFTTYK